MTTKTLNPPVGRSTLSFIDASHPDKPLEVNVYRPARHQPNDPVIVVQHGMLRNGDEYRDFWIPAADRYGLQIIAPAFAEETALRVGDAYQRATEWHLRRPAGIETAAGKVA